MAHSLTGNDRDRDLAGYRFARTPGRRVRARTTVSRINGYLRTVIEAIADSKLRRVERELELRGIRVNRGSNDRVVRNSEPAEGSR